MFGLFAFHFHGQGDIFKWAVCAHKTIKRPHRQTATESKAFHFFFFCGVPDELLSDRETVIMLVF